MEKLKLLVMTALTVGIAACSPVNFSTVKEGGSAPAVTPAGTTCNVETIYRKTKIMFLVDTSGSNHDTTYNNVNGSITSSPPTDPNKSFRGGAINSFFSTYSHKTNFSWGFATFSADVARAYINGGSNSTPQFASDTNRMSTAISNFYGASDSGNTPYASAISLAATAISNDPDVNSNEQPHYFIVLLSDGVPTDYTDINGSFRSAQMNSDVSNLLSRAPGRVSLSTIFYSVVDTDVDAVNAKSIMQQIATAGSGQFASVNTSNSNFKIDDVLGRTSCQ